jgi:hypothetical protein
VSVQHAYFTLAPPGQGDLTGGDSGESNAAGRAGGGAGCVFRRNYRQGPLRSALNAQCLPPSPPCWSVRPGQAAQRSRPGRLDSPRLTLRDVAAEAPQFMATATGALFAPGHGCPPSFFHRVTGDEHSLVEHTIGAVRNDTTAEETIASDHAAPNSRDRRGHSAQAP